MTRMPGMTRDDEGRLGITRDDKERLRMTRDV